MIIAKRLISSIVEKISLESSLLEGVMTGLTNVTVAVSVVTVEVIVLFAYT